MTVAAADSGKSPVELDVETLRQLAQILGVGIAVADPDGWAVLFENASFFKWFPLTSDADEPLTARLPGLDADRALTRLQADRTYSFETESEATKRTAPARASQAESPEPCGIRPAACQAISTMTST